VVVVGHIMMGETGDMVRVDAGFCSIMRASSAAMIGRSVLDVTAPEDRAGCRDAIRRLLATSEPFQVIKRLLRDDGTIVWVTNTVAQADFGDGPNSFVATVIPVDPNGYRGKPGVLLGYARALRDSRRARATTFATTLFTEPAWDLLLSAYIMEAEGGLLGPAALARAAGVSGPVALRWARALVSDGLLEVEHRHAAATVAEPHYRLADRAHETFERYMADRLRSIVGDVANL
jgi:PAS domain S-box-containing protein